jgi:hypothetical protein
MAAKFEGDDWLYRDSYFGGTNFFGQETVWLRGEPVWAENYYGLHSAARHDRRRTSRRDDQGRLVGDVSRGAFPGRV